MITEFNYPERDWQLYIKEVDLEYYLKFLNKFEIATKPIEKTSSFWHETITEYELREIQNNKIRIEYSDEILTIMFTENPDNHSKQFLMNITQSIDGELNNDSEI